MEWCDPLRARIDLLRYGPGVGSDGTPANADIHRWLPSNRYRRPDADQGSRETEKRSSLISNNVSRRRGIVVVDNVPFHKVAGVEEAIEARGAELRYLPRYSPDLNPIELIFHPLKTLLRKAAERATDGLQHALAPSCEDSSLPNAQARRR